MTKELGTADLPSLIGTELEPSEWLEMTQERVDWFAKATDDFQFIHVDPERAAKTPFGGTIAHGFLVLSMIPYLASKSELRVQDAAMTVNYGCDGYRFLAPVRTGDRIRLSRTIADVQEKRPGEWLVKTAVTIDIEGQDTPAIAGEFLALYIKG